MFLKNRNISSKIKRSKVTDYAALRWDLTDLILSNMLSPARFLNCRTRGVSGNRLCYVVSHVVLVTEVSMTLTVFVNITRGTQVLRYLGGLEVVKLFHAQLNLLMLKCEDLSKVVFIIDPDKEIL